MASISDDTTPLKAGLPLDFVVSVAVIFAVLISFSEISKAFETPAYLLAWQAGVSVVVLVIYTVMHFNIESGRRVTDERHADTYYYLGFIMTLVSLILGIFNQSEVLSAPDNKQMLMYFSIAMVSTVIGLVCRACAQYNENISTPDVDERFYRTLNGMTSDAELFRDSLQSGAEALGGLHNVARYGSLQSHLLQNLLALELLDINTSLLKLEETFARAAAKRGKRISASEDLSAFHSRAKQVERALSRLGDVLDEIGFERLHSAGIQEPDRKELEKIALRLAGGMENSDGVPKEQELARFRENMNEVHHALEGLKNSLRTAATANWRREPASGKPSAAIESESYLDIKNKLGRQKQSFRRGI